MTQISQFFYDVTPIILMLPLSMYSNLLVLLSLYLVLLMHSIYLNIFPYINILKKIHHDPTTLLARIKIKTHLITNLQSQPKNYPSSLHSTYSSFYYIYTQLTLFTLNFSHQIVTHIHIYSYTNIYIYIRIYF